MATKLGIYNSCYIKLGAEIVSATTDDNKRNNLLNAIYDTIRLKQLREHPWNFAIKRTQLTADTGTPSWKWGTGYTLPTDYLKIKEVRNDIEYRIEGNLLYVEDAAASVTTDATETGSTDTVLNATSHSAQARDIIEIDGERRAVASVTDNTITLTSALTAAPADDTEFSIERPPEIFVEYIADIEEENFTADFAETLSWCLASEICYALVQNRELSNQMLEKAEFHKKLARSMDAQEGTPPEIMDNDFINVRY